MITSSLHHFIGPIGRRNMRLTLAGKLIVFLVFCSILYYAWTRLVPAGAKEQITALRNRLPGGGTVAPPGRSGGSEGGEPTRAEQPGDLLFITTAAKKDW